MPLRTYFLFAFFPWEDYSKTCKLLLTFSCLMKVLLPISVFEKSDSP